MMIASPQVGSGRTIVLRRLLGVGVALALAVPAAGASKDMERLQILIATLQSQLAEVRRMAEENTKEIRRLNEMLAEQNALLKKGQADARTSDEAAQAAMREVSEALGEIKDQLQRGVPLSALPAASVPPVGGLGQPLAGSASAPGTAPPAPKELYSQAYADYARGNFDLAIQGFQEYLKNYADTDLADNAQYWIGECLYSKQKHSEAIEAWNTLFRDFPASDKLPDARVKKGMALEKLGRRSQALVEYRYVVERYPNSPAARQARDRLNP
jgi:tol-pal system protein YbgF